MTPDELLNGLDMVELVSGMVLGPDPDVPVPQRHGDPRTVLEEVLLEPLAKAPCGIAFSGGRDSSGLLGAATAAARRHGLPDPVPITFRFPGVDATVEDGYQEAVVRHLGLDEWIRIEPGESLDVLGDASTSLTARYGVLFPGNIHILVPLLEPFRGGALLTGAGGDEMLGGNPHYDLVRMLSGRRLPDKALLRQVAKRVVAPGRDRERSRRSAEAHLTWLVPEVRRQVAETYARNEKDPWSAATRLTAGMYPNRYIHRTQRDMAVVAAGYAATLAHPFLDPRFVGAMAGHVGRTGYRDRAGVMTFMFGDVLPEQVNRRSTKARFDDVFWTRRSAERVGHLPVEVLADYVDPVALRELWASDRPKGNTSLIVKYLWQRTAPERDGRTALGRAEY